MLDVVVVMGAVQMDRMLGPAPPKRNEAKSAARDMWLPTAPQGHDGVHFAAMHVIIGLHKQPDRVPGHSAATTLLVVVRAFRHHERGLAVFCTIQMLRMCLLLARMAPGGRKCGRVSHRPLAVAACWVYRTPGGFWAAAVACLALHCMR